MNKESKPSGWKLVPTEPTQWMVQRGKDHRHDGFHVEDIYRSMTAAAPVLRDPFMILDENGWGLVPLSVPTGGDDYDVEWVVVEYHMAEPKERVIGRGKTPHDALGDAAPV